MSNAERTRRMTSDRLKPGMRVRIVQSIAHRSGAWTTAVEGTVVELADAPTGSWYAHGKNDHYWLKRVKLRKDDGELTLLALDQNSSITLL